MTYIITFLKSLLKHWHWTRLGCGIAGSGAVGTQCTIHVFEDRSSKGTTFLLHAGQQGAAAEGDGM